MLRRSRVTNAAIGNYVIIAIAGDGGSITLSGPVVVTLGGSQTFTITPNENYSVADVEVDGVSQSKISTHTFDSVNKDGTITAAFSYNGSTGPDNPNPPICPSNPRGNSGITSGTVKPTTSSDYTPTTDKTSAKAGETVTVTVKKTDKNADYYVVSGVTAKGDTTVTARKNADGTFTFTTPAVTGSNGFADVPSNAFYKDAVQWAVNKGVTQGTSATTFEPDTACSRGQMVTFLNRYLGK